ncbi:MAG: hypothetical protein WC391_07695 [Methanoregula sp.]|jgi:hypothetical protein
MKTTMIIPVLACLCILIAFSGCTGTLTGTAGQGSTPAAAGTSSPTAGSSQTGASLTVGPTVTMESYNAVTVDVAEKDYNGVITVTFQGGMGQGNVQRIDVKLTRTDGTTKTLTLGSNKGNFVDLDGTRGSGSLQGQPDRVEVWVAMNNGQLYKIVDVLREYRTRQ